MGNTVIGAGGSNILLTEPMKKFYIPDGVETPLLKLSCILSDPTASCDTGASLAFFSVIRSACLQEVDFQGVGYIMGPSAVGKTYLAKQLFGFVGETGTAHFQPANVFESQTSTAGFLNAMTDAREIFPFVLDDIALSGSRNSQRKRADLAANIIRKVPTRPRLSKAGPEANAGMQSVCPLSLSQQNFPPGDLRTQPLYSNPHSGSPKTSGRAYSKVDGRKDSGIPSVFYSSTQFQRSNLLGSMRYTFPKQP